LAWIQFFKKIKLFKKHEEGDIMKKVYINFEDVIVQIYTENEILNYLDDFYDFLTEYNNLEEKSYFKIAALKEKPVNMSISPWGVGYSYNKIKKKLTLRANDIENLSISLRKSIREVLLVNRKNEVKTMLHSSLISNGQTNIFIIGESCSGKTSLAIDGVLNYGFKYISNDHLIITSYKNFLYARCLPVSISVKLSTYLEYENKLPNPFEIDSCVDIDKVRKMSLSEIYKLKNENIIYTYKQFNPKPSLPIINLNESNNFVLLSSFTNKNFDQFDCVKNVEDELLNHIRTDWMFDDDISKPRYIYLEKNKSSFIKDSNYVIEKFSKISKVMKWNHRGKIKPFLDLIEGGINNGN
jgi:hypothetical protein